MLWEEGAATLPSYPINTVKRHGCGTGFAEINPRKSKAGGHELLGRRNGRAEFVLREAFHPSDWNEPFISSESHALNSA